MIPTRQPEGDLGRPEPPRLAAGRFFFTLAQFPVQSQGYFAPIFSFKGLIVARKARRFHSFLQAQRIVQAMRIRGWQDYRNRYREDPLLPSDPSKVYEADWQGWPHFLGKSQYAKKYRSFAEASQAAQTLGIRTKQEYEERYHEDSQLPSTPNKFYTTEWSRERHPWLAFLGKPEPYRLYTVASNVAVKLGIKSRREYAEFHHEDPKLPASPESVYSDMWQGWGEFLKKDQ